MRSLIGFFLIALGASMLMFGLNSGPSGMFNNFLSAVFLIWGVVFAFKLDKFFWSTRKFDSYDADHLAIKPEEMLKVDVSKPSAVVYSSADESSRMDAIVVDRNGKASQF